MTRYKISIRKKDQEFSYEEDNLSTFKDGLLSFAELVEEFGKPVGKITNASKRGGRRTAFVSPAVQELISKEPQWFADKFPEDITRRLKTQYGVPGAKDSNVRSVLVRLFKNGYLTRKEIQGKFAYSVTNIPR